MTLSILFLLYRSNNATECCTFYPFIVTFKDVGSLQNKLYSYNQSTTSLSIFLSIYNIIIYNMLYVHNIIIIEICCFIYGCKIPSLLFFFIFKVH